MFRQHSQLHASYTNWCGCGPVQLQLGSKPLRLGQHTKQKKSSAAGIDESPASWFSCAARHTLTYMILKWRVVVVVCVYYFSNFNVLSLAKKRDSKGGTSAHVRNRSEVRMSAHNKIVLENLRVDQALLSFSRSLDEKCFVVSGVGL